LAIKDPNPKNNIPREVTNGNKYFFSSDKKIKIAPRKERELKKASRERGEKIFRVARKIKNIPKIKMIKDINIIDITNNF
jgi:hypothetical protein